MLRNQSYLRSYRCLSRLGRFSLSFSRSTHTKCRVLTCKRSICPPRRKTAGLRRRRPRNERDRDCSTKCHGIINRRNKQFSMIIYVTSARNSSLIPSNYKIVSLFNCEELMFAPRFGHNSWRFGQIWFSEISLFCIIILVNSSQWEIFIFMNKKLNKSNA